MRRPPARLAVLVLLALAACQDYQFTPVGRCLLQPGYASVSTVAATDVLFVVDDSYSMEKFQESLANNLGTFIDRLAAKQQERANAGKDPYDFHIAVTSSSVLVNKGAEVLTSYYNYTSTGACTRGVLVANGDPYPAGAFLALGNNPRMLSFTKDLDWRHVATDPTIQRLIAEFKDNVKVGSCGANQEMPLEAAMRAIQRGSEGRQGVAWPHAKSKIALVFVTNEDDCSTSGSNQGGLVWDNRPQGIDSCAMDAARPTPTAGLYSLDRYLTFLRDLQRPLAAAFVVPQNGSCSVGVSSPRLGRMYEALKKAGADAIQTDICGDFAGALTAIADELPPADRLQLPSIPAADKVIQLRIQGADGSSLHVCDGPGKTKEWWFVDCTTSAPLDGVTSACVAVKPGGACEARAGQTLQAEYLGRVPADGCATPNDCTKALGGALTDWKCEGASSNLNGTCVCSGS